MQDFELQLLARLVNGFPAGNISVILLINSAGNYQSKVEAFGKNLVKWEVETEAGEAKQQLTDWVATTPDPEPAQIEPTFSMDPPTLNDEVVPVSKLLNIPTKTAWRVPGFGKKEEPKVEPETLPTFVPPLPQTAAIPAQPVAPMVPPAVMPAGVGAPLSASAMDTSREPSLQANALPAADADLFKRQPRKSRAGWVLLILLVSIGVFGLMYKEVVLQEVEALKKYLLRGTPAVPAPEEAASAAAAASAASAEALAAAELAASIAAEAARVASDAQEVASAASAVASVTASESVASADEPVKKKTEKELRVEKAQAKPESNSDEAWVEQLPASGYVVQLAAMDTQDDMRSFQRSNAVYAKARILRARQKDSNKRYYILVAGPFESKSQADAFMQSSPLLAKGWLRSSKSMKTQFTKS
jgi:hypothetical protein